MTNIAPTRRPQRWLSAVLGPLVVISAIACGSNSSGTKSPDAASGGSASGGSAGGGGASTAGGGSAGSATVPLPVLTPPDYNPCANQSTPCVILPLGDSITYGDASSDTAGYRSRLYHLALQAKKSITFVGNSSDGPEMVDGKPFPKHHEGHPGFTIDDNDLTKGIMPLTAESITTNAPQVVLLEIGTNDMVFKVDPPNAPMRLGALLDLIFATKPDLLVVVAQITPTQTEASNKLIRTYNAAIPDVVKSKAAAGMHVYVIDNYAALASNPSFATEYLANENHPGDAGYTRMAENWFGMLGTLFPKAP